MPGGSPLDGASFSVAVLCPGSGGLPADAWLWATWSLVRAAGDFSAVSGRTPLGPLYCQGQGSGHGTGAGRLDSLESKVGFDNACVSLEEDGVKAVAHPVSVLKPIIVSKLPEDLGSKA